MTGPNLWDQRYASKSYVYGTEPNDFLVSVVERLPAGRVVCVAEGEGRNAVYLASLGSDVTAVDYSGMGLQKASRLAAQRGVVVKTRLSDLDEFDFGQEEWSVVVSIFCHLESIVRRRVHARIVAGLRAGGMLVLEAYTPNQLELRTGGPSRRDMLVTLEELQDELHGLDFQIGREIERNVNEGSLHCGRSAVVQVLARKPERLGARSVQRPSGSGANPESAQ